MVCRLNVDQIKPQMASKNKEARWCSGCKRAWSGPSQQDRMTNGKVMRDEERRNDRKSDDAREQEEMFTVNEVGDQEGQGRSLEGQPR